MSSGGNAPPNSRPDNINGGPSGSNSSNSEQPSPFSTPRIFSDINIARRSRHHGLDLEDISLLPIFPYEPIRRSCRNQLEKVLTAECAVCLGELEEGEMIRVLPTCKHYFHVECTDMWWLSMRSSCPIFRAHPEPEKVKSGLLSISPPWPHLMHSSSSEQHHSRQLSLGSCIGSPFVKTPSHKSLSPISTSPFHGSWQGSPNILATLATDLDLQLIPAETHANYGDSRN